MSLPLAESGAVVHARQAGHWQHLTLLKGVQKGRGNMLARTSTQLHQSPSPWTLLPPGARTLVTLVSDADGMWKMENGMCFGVTRIFFSRNRKNILIPFQLYSLYSHEPSQFFTTSDLDDVVSAFTDTGSHRQLPCPSSPAILKSLDVGETSYCCVSDSVICCHDMGLDDRFAKLFSLTVGIELSRAVTCCLTRHGVIELS